MAADFLGAYRELLEQLSGRSAGDTPATSGDFLDEAYARYGEIKSPTDYASQITAANEEARASGVGGRPGYSNIQRSIRDQMRQSYGTYKDTANQLRDLYTERRAGITDPEQLKAEREAFNAAKQQAYAEHGGNRAYLKTQGRSANVGRKQALKDLMNRKAEDMYQRNLQSGAKAGVDVSGFQRPEFGRLLQGSIKRGNKGYEAVKDLGRGLEVERQPGMNLGESIGQMFNEAGSRIKSRKRGLRGYASR